MVEAAPAEHSVASLPPFIPFRNHVVHNNRFEQRIHERGSNNRDPDVPIGRENLPHDSILRTQRQETREQRHKQYTTGEVKAMREQIGR